MSKLFRQKAEVIQNDTLERFMVIAGKQDDPRTWEHIYKGDLHFDGRKFAASVIFWPTGDPEDVKRSVTISAGTSVESGGQAIDVSETYNFAFTDGWHNLSPSLQHAEALGIGRAAIANAMEETN